MPDFSKPQGGFGAGKAGSNVPFSIVVIEEYADGSVSTSLPSSSLKSIGIYNVGF